MMRRLVLILGLAVLAWLGRRELRSAAHAQRYLTLLALLQIIAVMGKTSASAKSVSTENRLNTVVMPKLGSLSTAVAPIAGNSAFLGTLNGASTPITAGFLGLSFTGPGGTQSVANLYSYLNGGFATLMSSLIAYTGALGTCVNSIISQGGNVGIWP
jgi:hypothetical protein